MLVGVDGNEANISNRVGSGQYGFELIHQFAKIKTEHNFLVYLKNNPIADLPKESSNLKYLVLGPKKFWTQLALPVKLFFQKPRPDVFFTPTHYAPRFSPVPLVVTVFDLSFIHYPEMFRKQDRYQLRSWTEYSVKKAAKIITISKSSKEDIAKYYKVAKDKTVVTYPGVGENFTPQPKEKIESVKRKYKIKEDYILYVGTIQPRKNLIRLIEAFNSLIHNSGWRPSLSAFAKSDLASQRSIQNFQLVIAGKKGWLYGEIFEKVKELKLENKVIFTDFIPTEDLPALYSGAKVFVNVSLWEGFGIPVLEAIACGIPVVVSNTSSLPEVVGEAGLLVNPANVGDIALVLARVLNMPRQEYENLKKKSVQQAKKFSWEKCAGETLTVLESVSLS